MVGLTPDFFPGIPGPGGTNTANFTVEAVACLKLAVGTNSFGISSGAERVDANDDDGFQVFVGANPTDFFSTKVAEVNPFPGSSGIDSSAAIQVLIVDGVTHLAPASVALSLNGKPLAVTKAPLGRGTLESYKPSPLRIDPNNAVRLIYSDSATFKETNSWGGAFSVKGGNPVSVAGQWDFDSGDLRATIGSPLEYLVPTLDGPAGSSGDKTSLGTGSRLKQVG